MAQAVDPVNGSGKASETDTVLGVDSNIGHESSTGPISSQSGTLFQRR